MTNGIISIVLNGEAITVQNTKISITDILNPYILILQPRANLLKDMMTSYNSERKRNLSISIYSLGRNEIESSKIAGNIENYLSKNQQLLSKEGLRFGRVIDIYPLSDINTVGYSVGIQKIFAYVLTLRGFCMF